MLVPISPTDYHLDDEEDFCDRDCLRSQMWTLILNSKTVSNHLKLMVRPEVNISAIRHSVDRALPALSALSDLQFLQLSQLFQLSQFCQFFHSSDALSSPSSSNFEIENWKSLWKNERTNRVGRAGKARRAGKIGDPRELRELEEPKASEERETYKSGQLFRLGHWHSWPVEVNHQH